MSDRAELHLADAKEMPLDHNLRMFTKQTGHEPTEEEYEVARRMMLFAWETCRR